MIDYVDPIPPIVSFLSVRTDMDVYGNTFDANAALPAILVRNAGGNGFTRVLLICRAERDYEAMGRLIDAVNIMVRYSSQIKGLRVIWCERESNPIPDKDEDTGKPEAWCYLRLEHLEG